FKLFHNDSTDILNDIEATVDRQLWCTAAKHESADDLADGADMYQVCRKLRRLRPDDEGDNWALNAVVVTGGQWPRERLRAAGYQ
ncbi:unnamed protein product, partial [Prorocentrum cordatum]